MSRLKRAAIAFFFPIHWSVKALLKIIVGILSLPLLAILVTLIVVIAVVGFLFACLCCVLVFPFWCLLKLGEAMAPPLLRAWNGFWSRGD